MIDAASILQSLATRRPVFHSEADFQHEFAWEIRLRYPQASVRLEVPSPIPGVGTTDLLVRAGEVTTAIELKYLTRRLKVELGSETFDLRNHGAQDVRAYDCMKDIGRLECYTKATAARGLAITITNDASYWGQGSGRATNAAAFRLSDGRLVEGALAWGPSTGAGTNRGRESPVLLRNSYVLHWRDYADLGVPSGIFRALCVAVD